MDTRKTWDEFLESKMLWFVNRTLHIFGWVIILVYEDDGSFKEAYPARTACLGFSEDTDEAGRDGFLRSIRADENAG